MQDPALRGPILNCLATVSKKVGEHLHLHAADPMDDVGSLADQAAFLWARNERVVVVVDGAEAYSAGAIGAGQTIPGSGYDARLSLVAYELSRLANQGCAVVTTCDSAAASLLAPAATVMGELRAVTEPVARGAMKKKGIGARPMDLAILKNRLGPTPTLPLVFSAAASVFEERLT